VLARPNPARSKPVKPPNFGRGILPATQTGTIKEGLVEAGCLTRDLLRFFLLYTLFASIVWLKIRFQIRKAETPVQWINADILRAESDFSLGNIV